jgi:hypothetical protein
LPHYTEFINQPRLVSPIQVAGPAMSTAKP